MLILVTPIIIPLVIIGIVKACSNKKTDQNPPYIYTMQNGYYSCPQPPYPNCPPPPQAYQNRPADQPPKAAKKHDMTVSNILFLIGTAFVVLSGLAFGVAKWVHTSHEGRVAIIMAASAVSF